jgi:hypothetical protein
MRLLVVVTAAALAATAVQAQEKFSGAIHGRIVDQNGDRVVGAQVTIMPGARHVISFEDGGFDFGNIKPGEYTISARRIGYDPASAVFTVRDSAIYVAITLVALPQLLDSIRIREKAVGLRFNGIVMDQNQEPVKNAEVMAVGIDNTLHTDSLGRFFVPKLGRGAFMIRIRKIGYAPLLSSYYLFSDRVDTLELARLSQSLSPVQIEAESGFGRDFWDYKDLDQRHRWKTFGAGTISRDELAEQGGKNLCDAIPSTPSASKLMLRFDPICPEHLVTILLNGGLCIRRDLGSFVADDVEMVEYFAAGSDKSGSLLHRNCAPPTYVIWMRKEIPDSLLPSRRRP